MIALKLLAIAVGALLAATSAYALTSTVGGFDTVAGRTVVALALGVVAGSIVVGVLADRRTAAIILLAMAAGELYALAGTAERVMAAREAQQAPLREAQAKHDRAAEALRTAQAAKPAPASRERLETATAAHRAATEAVRGSAADMGCRANCAALLQAAVDSATRELAAARDAITAHDEAEAKRIASGVAAAQAVLDAAPVPTNASPLADFLHITPRTLDILMAACLSLGLNGMAAALIAVGAHGLRRQEVLFPSKPRLVSSTVPVLSLIDFGANALEAAPGAKLDFEEFSDAYDRAARDAKKRALSDDEFSEPFKSLCATAGIRTAKRGSKVFLCDVRLAI
jgi:hypothetical protein